MDIVNISDTNVVIPPEDETCNQQYLSLVEETPEPGKHLFTYLSPESQAPSVAGVICILCGRSWFPKQ